MNLPPIPKLDETPNLPEVEDTPLVGETFGTSPMTSSLPPVSDFDAWAEISSVKDSVTFGILMRKTIEGSTGASEIKIYVDDVDLTKDFVGTIDVGVGGKMVASTKEKLQKEGDLILEPMVTKVAAPLDYPATTNDTISLVGKPTIATRPSLGGFMP